VNTCIVDL